MNVKNEVHRSLLPLLDEWSPDRWDAIEADIRRRKLQVVPPKKPRLKKHLTRLLLCAVLSVAVFGMMLCLPFVDNWFATQNAMPVQPMPLQQDKIVVNEVEKIGYYGFNQKPILGACEKELNFNEAIEYLEYDILSIISPQDLYFRKDIFEQELSRLEYGADGNLIDLPLYNNFRFTYTSKEISNRRMYIYCSKVTAMVGTVKYFHDENISGNPSVINNVEVRIGHVAMMDVFEGYTQKLPTERYVAEFTIHDINIQVTADNLTLEEFVTVIKSMIR